MVNSLPDGHHSGDTTDNGANDMDKITISVQILNQVMGYLGARPYQEVYQLITALQAEAKEQLSDIEAE